MGPYHRGGTFRNHCSPLLGNVKQSCLGLPQA